MWLWYDWRAAAVADAEGQLHDEESSEPRSVRDVAERLSLLAAGGLPPEARALAARFPDAVVLPAGSPELPDATWPAVPAALLPLLDEAALLQAEAGVDAAAADRDRRLEHLVRATEEVRAHASALEGRLVEWLGLFLPRARVEGDRREVARALLAAESVPDLAAGWEVEAPPSEPLAAEWLALRSLGAAVLVDDQRVKELEGAQRELVWDYLPSTAALVGPLLAAKLCVQAGGRMRLARMASGAVQTLGAESALFMHLRGEATSPKHGHLFQHPWVHRSHRKARGKVARYLAGRVSLTARLDAFDGTVVDDEFTSAVDARVTEIRSAVMAGLRR